MRHKCSEHILVIHLTVVRLVFSGLEAKALRTALEGRRGFHRQREFGLSSRVVMRIKEESAGVCARSRVEIAVAYTWVKMIRSRPYC